VPPLPYIYRGPKAVPGYTGCSICVDLSPNYSRAQAIKHDRAIVTRVERSTELARDTKKRNVIRRT